jgi:hypothetical protein
VTPKRRQGTGRAAFDHISAQLSESLSTLSKVTASQTAIAEAARGDIDRTIAVLGRLDDKLLAAVLVATRTVETLIRAEQHTRHERARAAEPPEGISP